MSNDNEQEGLPARADKRLQAKFGNVKDQSAKTFVGKKGEKLSIGPDALESKATLYFGTCEDCEYTVDVQCTKILMESCKRTKLILNGGVITNILEIWKSDDCNTVINTRIATIQLDLCKKLDVQFTKKENYHSVVWAGVHDLSLNFQDAPEHKFETSFLKMKEKHADLSEQTDQFIIRFLGDVLVQELILRLPGGFPTTEREAAAFDENQKKKEEYYRIQAEKLIKFVPRKFLAEKPKAARNDPCPCKSGKKYKNCCGSVKAGEKEKHDGTLADPAAAAPSPSPSPAATSAAPAAPSASVPAASPSAPAADTAAAAAVDTKK